MIKSLALAVMCLIGLAAAPAAAAKFRSDRLSVEVHGKGPDVVLIPGLSSSPRVWDTTIKAVPGYRYHVVRVAGFDGTAPGANGSGPVVEPVAAEIARYIREAKLDKPALIGHSLGGTWAMLVAGRNPGIASRVMVVDMLPFLGAMFGGPGATPESVRPVAEQIRKAITGADPERRKTMTEQTIATMVKTEALRPTAVAQSLASDAKVSGQAYYDLVQLDLRPEVARIGVPLTVLWVKPPAAPVSEEQMAGFYKISYAGAPQAVVKHIPDSYHFIMFDQPEVFQAEVRDFLK